jgi:thiol:disulfide interchange protein
LLRAEASGVVEARGILRPAAGAWKPFALHITVKEGWHVNANPALLRFLVPTQVKDGERPVRGLRYPEAERYEGSVTIEGEVEASGDGPVSVSLTYQACDEERCLAPVTREVALR